MFSDPGVGPGVFVMSHRSVCPVGTGRAEAAGSYSWLQQLKPWPDTDTSRHELEGAHPEAR